MTILAISIVFHSIVCILTWTMQKKRTLELMKEADGTREKYGIKEMKFDKEKYERLGGYAE